MSEPEQRAFPLRPGGALLLVFVHFAAFMTITIILASLTRGGGEDEATVIGPWNVPIAQALGLLMALYVGLVRYAPGEPLPVALRAPRPNARAIAVAVIAVGVGIAAYVPAYGILLRILVARVGALDEVRAQAQALPTSGLALGFGAQLVLVPLASELLFRGFVQGRLALSVGPGRAMLATAVLASLAHLNPFLMPSGLILALPLGVLALLTGSIWAPLAGHVSAQTAELVLGGVLDATPVGPTPAAMATGGGLAVVGLGIAWAIARPARGPAGTP